jgi:cell division protein FtsL
MPAGGLDRRVGIDPQHRTTKGERTMYIGIGTIVLILAVIILFMLLRGRRV